MELIINYKKGIVTDYPLLVAERQFSMGADTFLNREEIEQLIKSCDNDIYILCNRMMFDEDLESLQNHLEWLQSLNIKGIYFADMAVFMIAQQLEMLELLIYAPGMPLVNHEDVQIYLEFGIQGVELANELTLEEKTNIMKKHPNQVGTVVGGYLMSSASRRHFLTNYFNEINHPHNLEDNYDLALIESTRTGRMPLYEDHYGTYIYSEYILDSFMYLESLKDHDAGLLRIDSIFLDVSCVNDLIAGYHSVLIGKDAKQQQERFLNKYPELPFEIGFYDTETNLVKE